MTLCTLHQRTWSICFVHMCMLPMDRSAPIVFFFLICFREAHGEVGYHRVEGYKCSHVGAW